MTESEVFDKMDWNKPEIGKFGVTINCKSHSALFYEKNFYRLLEILSENLKGFEQVITHNPWGEYGHEEHVQVYRAVKTLQSKIGYDIWFSNYFSNKSFNLLSRYLTNLSAECIKSRTNKFLTKSIKAIYEKNQCWTWYKDWEWLDEEILIKEKNTDSKKEIFNHTLPMNFIKVRHQDKRNKKHVFDKILRLKNKLIRMVR